MRILIACEFSGIVRDAFIENGHYVESCDLLPTESPGPHHQGDVIEYLNQFPDGHFHLIIAHPECTKLCVSGNRHYGEGKDKYYQRVEAVEWTLMFWELAKRKGKMVCFENPVGVLHRMSEGKIPKAQYIQPHMFGHKEQKKTGLHLHRLPPLLASENVYAEMMKLPKRERERIHHMPPSTDRSKIRSTTFQGIADAMSEQWGA